MNYSPFGLAVDFVLRECYVVQADSDARLLGDLSNIFV